MADDESDDQAREPHHKAGPKEHARSLIERLGRIDFEALTPRQAMLVEDCRGMLSAIVNGHVLQAPLVRDRLIEAASLYGTPETTMAKLTKQQQMAMDEFRYTVRMASAYGLAMDPAVDQARRSGRDRS